jgi:hypothetical protein
MLTLVPALPWPPCTPPLLQRGKRAQLQEQLQRLDAQHARQHEAYMACKGVYDDTEGSFLAAQKLQQQRLRAAQQAAKQQQQAAKQQQAQKQQQASGGLRAGFFNAPAAVKPASVGAASSALLPAATRGPVNPMHEQQAASALAAEHAARQAALQQAQAQAEAQAQARAQAQLLQQQARQRKEAAEKEERQKAAAAQEAARKKAAEDRKKQVLALGLAARALP